jgi:hypothetical protein
VLVTVVLLVIGVILEAVVVATSAGFIEAVVLVMVVLVKVVVLDSVVLVIVVLVIVVVLEPVALVMLVVLSSVVLDMVVVLVTVVLVMVVVLVTVLLVMEVLVMVVVLLMVVVGTTLFGAMTDLLLPVALTGGMPVLWPTRARSEATSALSRRTALTAAVASSGCFLTWCTSARTRSTFLLNLPSLACNLALVDLLTGRPPPQMQHASTAEWPELPQSEKVPWPGSQFTA